MMRRAILLSLAWLAWLPLPQVWAQLPTWQRAVVFGDSLSDTGNLFLATLIQESGLPPQPGFPFGGDEPLFPAEFYFQGRFSNGPIWLEHLAEDLQLLPPAPFSLGGSTYAFGGAETGEGISQRLTPNLGTQLALFADNDGSLSPSDLVIVWAGGNDFNAVPPNLPPSPEDVVQRLVGHLVALHQAGGEFFLVPNLPPLGNIPQIRSQGPLIQGLANLTALQYNLLLDAALDDLESQLGITIYRLNTFGLVAKITADPGQVGLVNVTDPAFDLLSRTVVSDPDSYLYWDTEHPTRKAHQILGAVAGAGLRVSQIQDALPTMSFRGWLGPLYRFVLQVEIGLIQTSLDVGDLQQARELLAGFQGRVQTLQRWGVLRSSDASALKTACSQAIQALESVLD